MPVVQVVRRGRPKANESLRKRADLLVACAGALELRLAPGFSLERTMDELGLSPRALIRLLDDPQLPATLEAMAGGTAQAA